MKECIKFAEEYAKSVVSSDRVTSDDWVNITFDYLEGFRKALEMAEHALMCTRNPRREDIDAIRSVLEKEV